MTRPCASGSDVAKGQIDEVTAAVRNVKQTFIRDVIAQTGLDDPYMSVHEAAEILDENLDEAPLEVIEQAYRAYVMENQDLTPRYSGFCLIDLESNEILLPQAIAWGSSSGIPNILRYLGAVGPGEQIESQIVELMHSPEMVYQYQLYEIIEWFYERSTDPSVQLVELVRRIAFQDAPRYLKTVCRASSVNLVCRLI